MFRNLPHIAFALLLFVAAPPRGESAAPSQTLPRVRGPIDESQRVALRGNVHPLAQARFDKGVVEDNFSAGRMLLLLQRSTAQESALEDFIHAEHTPGDPAFHRWLKPEEFGRLYGPADSDVAAVVAWLESHGFTTQRASGGRIAIEFSGTAAQIREAFHTSIHRFVIHGETHVANATDPEVPAALSPVIAGIAQMNDFQPKSYLERLGRAEYNPKTGDAKPDWTYPEGGGAVNLVVAPGDFAVEYDINPVYNGKTTGAKINGAGQTIGIISASNVNMNLVAAYRKLFHLGANLPEVVIDGSDPGENGAKTEAYLDMEMAGSVAPGAQIVVYTSDGTAMTGGLSLAAYRAVEDDFAGILSTSYGECEANLGQGGNAFWYALWQQAAAQGQTSFVSAGDGGSAGCENFDSQELAFAGLAVSGFASTPYDVAVGGTDFFYSDYASPKLLSTQLTEYWSTTATRSPGVSILKPIPEQPWNDYLGLNTTDKGKPQNYPSENIVAGSGGMSSAATYPPAGGLGYLKPTWQTGKGVPNDLVRDLPDLSLFAANGYNFSFYPICASPGDCTNTNPVADGGAVWITGIGGTSASAPAMAGIQALINQSTNSRQGQADYFYYPIAKQWPDAFRDITVGGNEVVCAPGTIDCIPEKPGTPGTNLYVESGYAAGPGYDLATGLGSVDVAELIHWWPQVSLRATVTTLGVSPATFVHGTAATITGGVAAKSGPGTPSGAVSLTSNNSLPHSAGVDVLTLNDGTLNTSLDNLPGGTYELTAQYGGDGTFAASKSSPVKLTVTPESPILMASGWVWNPYDLDLYPLTPGFEVPYGAQIFLDAQPVSKNTPGNAAATPGTGTVTFTDKRGAATATSTQPLNTYGVAEWESGVFAPGSHIVNESYSGDASYQPATLASAERFTVIPGSTVLSGGPLERSVAAGGTVTVAVELQTGYLPLFGVMPTGKVKVTLGGVSQTVPWSAFGPSNNAVLDALVTFTGVPGGILPVTASYAGDANWQGSTANFGTVTAVSARLTPSVKLTASSTHPLVSQLITLTATVSGPVKTKPGGTVVFEGDDAAINFAANLDKAGTASVTFLANQLYNGSNLFTAYYEGDSTFNAASSTAIDVSLARGGFSLTTLTPEVAIAPGKSGAATLVLTPVNGYNAAIQLNFSVPAGSGITAKAASLPTTVSKTATDTVTLTVPAKLAAGTYPIEVTATGNAGKIVHTALLLVSVPAS